MAKLFSHLILLVLFWVLHGRTGASVQESKRDYLHGRVHPRNEIDLTTEKQVLLCAGQNKSLECLFPGSSIAIMDSFWGRLTDKLCPSEDGDPTINCPTDPATTGLIRQLCDDKVFCQIPARHTILQNPGTQHCPGVNKYLIVNYTCIPNEHKLILCNGETTKLQCGQGWKLNVMSAFWGRTSLLTCPTPLGHPSRFGTCENLNNTIDNLKIICQGREECVVRADDLHMAQGKTYCPDVEKYAMISYRCQPQGPDSGTKGQPQQTANDASNLGNLVQAGSENSQRTNLNLYHSSQVAVQRISSNGLLMKTTFEQDLEKQLMKGHATNAKTHTKLDNSTRLPEMQNQVTEANLAGSTNKSPQGKGLDRGTLVALLREYLQTKSRRNGNVTSDTELPVTHDSHANVNNEKVAVPQDNTNVDIQHQVAMLKKLLRNKALVNAGSTEIMGLKDKEQGDEVESNVRPTANSSTETMSENVKVSRPAQGSSQELDQVSTNASSAPHKQDEAQPKKPMTQDEALKILSQYSHKSEGEIKQLLYSFEARHLGENRVSGMTNSSTGGSSERGTDQTNAHPSPLKSSVGDINSISPDEHFSKGQQHLVSNSPPTTIEVGAGNQFASAANPMPTQRISPTFDITNYQNSGLSLREGGNTQAHSMNNVGSGSAPMAIPTAPSNINPLKTLASHKYVSTGKITALEPTEKIVFKLRPTTTVGGKVVSNTFYKQYLKDAMRKESNGALQQEQQGQAAINALSKKVNALQTISDALGLLTEKISPDANGAKRHHRHHAQSLEERIDTKDVDYIQNKINEAIEMAESMGRKEISKNPKLVQLDLAGKVTSEMLGYPRNEVEKATESIIEKQIKAIEDSLNRLAEDAGEQGGSTNSKPTPSQLKQLNVMNKSADTNSSVGQSHSSENMQSSDQNLNPKSNSEILQQKLKELDFNDEELTMSQKGKTELQNGTSQRPVDIPSRNISHAANSIAKALRRQTSSVQHPSHFVSKNVTIALKPIITIQDYHDAALGGRINNEVIKEKKKEELFKGRDVKYLLQTLRLAAHPTVKMPVNKPNKMAISASKNTEEPHWKLDDSTIALLEKVVKHLLLQKQEEANRESSKEPMVYQQTRKQARKKKAKAKKKKKKKKDEDEDNDEGKDEKEDDEPIMVYDYANKDSSENAKKKDELDQELLDQIETQLNKLENYENKVHGLPNDSQENDNMNSEEIKTVATDQTKEDGKLQFSLPDKAPRKPKAIPTDDDVDKVISSYTGRKGIAKLLLKLQSKIAEFRKPEDVNNGLEVSATKAESADSSAKPHVIEFSGAELSGKIGSDTVEEAVRKHPIIGQLAGGKILESGFAVGYKPKSKETFSLINAVPTTKAKTTAPPTTKAITTAAQADPTTRAMIRKHNRLRISKIVKGVRLLLKALRGERLKDEEEGKDGMRYRGEHLRKVRPQTKDASSKEDGQGHEDRYGDLEQGDMYFGQNQDAISNAYDDTPKHDKHDKQDKQNYGYYEYGDFNQDPYYQSKAADNLFKSGSYDPQQLLSYDSQYDQGLLKRLTSSPSSEYTGYGYSDYSRPYSSYLSQPQGLSYAPSTRRELEPGKKPALPKKIRHALNKALKSDPVIKLVENFAEDEDRLMGERLKDFTKHSNVLQSNTKTHFNTDLSSSFNGKPVQITRVSPNSVKKSRN